MAYPCPSCGSAATAYYHRCSAGNQNRFVVKSPAPDPDPNTGKPAPVPCPDGLVMGMNPLIPPTPRPTGCTSVLTHLSTLIDARTLYCFNCKTVTVFPQTAAG